MKKLLASAAALSLAASMNCALPTIASADTSTSNSPAGVCQAGLAAFLGVSQGNCIQIVAGSSSDGVTNANALCNLWQGPLGVAIFGIPYPFATMGQCTSAINAFFHS